MWFDFKSEWADLHLSAHAHLQHRHQLAASDFSTTESVAGWLDVIIIASFSEIKPSPWQRGRLLNLDLSVDTELTECRFNWMLVVMSVVLFTAFVSMSVFGIDPFHYKTSMWKGEISCPQVKKIGKLEGSFLENFGGIDGEFSFFIHQNTEKN